MWRPGSTVRAPPAWLLAIEGRSFGLGDGLSAAAQRHLEAATALAQQWLQARRGAGRRLEGQR